MPRALTALLWLALAGAGGWAIWSGLAGRRAEDWRAWPVTESTITGARGISDGGAILQPEILVTHRFTVAGQLRESTILFKRDEIAGRGARFKPGSTLPWHYRPNDPEDGRFDLEGPWPLRLRVGLGALLALCGLALAIRSLHAGEIGD